MLSLKIFEILTKKALKTRAKGICKQAAMHYLRSFVKTGYGCLLCFSSCRSFAENANYKEGKIMFSYLT